MKCVISCCSIVFSAIQFIWIAANHNRHYIKALCRGRSRPYNFIERNPKVPIMRKHLATMKKEKNSPLTGRNLEYNQIQGELETVESGEKGEE